MGEIDQICGSLLRKLAYSKWTVISGQTSPAPERALVNLDFPDSTLLLIYLLLYFATYPQISAAATAIINKLHRLNDCPQRGEITQFG